MTKVAYLDYQQRAQGFSVGDKVVGTGASETTCGYVLRVFPAIGMIDVEFPWGMQRVPVEAVQNLSVERALQDSTTSRDLYRVSMPMINRIARVVAQEYMGRTALYWAAPDRKHRAAKPELESGHYTCPDCRSEEGEGIRLRKKTLTRSEGQNYQILVCPQCTFAIDTKDIINGGG